MCALQTHSRARLYLHLVFAVYFPIVIGNYIYYYSRTVWNSIQSINNNEHTSMYSCSSFFFKKSISARAHTHICDLWWTDFWALYIFTSIVFAFHSGRLGALHHKFQICWSWHWLEMKGKERGAATHPLCLNVPASTFFC